MCLYLLIGIYWTLALGALAFVFVLLNLYAEKKISWNADHMFSDVGRNYDYLLIGEPWDYSELNGRVITFFAPNRSMLSCYELTRRLYSLLNERTGKLIISCREKNIGSQSLSVLDVPYLHDTQLTKYHIDKAKLKKYLPFLFAPFATTSFFFARKRKVMGVVGEGFCTQTRVFCKERNINIEIVKTN